MVSSISTSRSRLSIAMSLMRYDRPGIGVRLRRSYWASLPIHFRLTQVAPETQHVQRPSLDGQLLGTRTGPVRATLGPKRARHAWRATCATCSTCAKCTACSSRARRAMCGARAACARCARARDSTHRDTCRPPPSVSKTNAQSRRVAIMVSGGPAHIRPYASTPAVNVKNNLTLMRGARA